MTGNTLFQASTNVLQGEIYIYYMWKKMMTAVVSMLQEIIAVTKQPSFKYR